MEIDKDKVRTAIVHWLKEMEKSSPVASAIVALNFGLFEPYGIELTGSENYDSEDDDWACDEDYVPSQRTCPNISIPEDNDWETVLEAITEILKNIVAERESSILNVAHVTTGFCDGDLNIVK